VEDVVSHNVFVNGKVHVRRTRCETCIFRPGNLMHLQPGRVEDMLAECGEDGCIPCHKHLDEEINPVCRGFFDRGTAIMQIAERMEVIEWT
jgi:hypothetical protein